jgi:hypothetical protein
MILYDNVCTPCVRKNEWRELRRIARKYKVELTRFDVKKQPQHMRNAWWDCDTIPLPVVEYESGGERIAVNLTEFLRLNTKEEA